MGSMLSGLNEQRDNLYSLLFILKIALFLNRCNEKRQGTGFPRPWLYHVLMEPSAGCPVML